MKKLSLVLLVLSMLLISCAGEVGKPQAPSQDSRVTTVEKAQPVSEKPWDSAVTKAKKEGIVNVYTTWVPELRTSIGKAFYDKWGIRVEYTSFARGSDFIAKVSAENKAGLYLADILATGSGSLVLIGKPGGLLGRLEPVLMLPEVVDPAVWRGTMPYADKEKTVIDMVMVLNRPVVYNSNLISKNEITTFKDLLKPEYKGKIVLTDPTQTGSGNFFMSHLAYDIMNEEGAKEFLIKLMAQNPAIQRDNRMFVDWVAMGKYPVGVAPWVSAATEHIAAGAPIAFAEMKEGIGISSGGGSLAVPPRFAHPSAAILFTNWILSKEGQTVFAKGFGSPSIRQDVSTEGIDPVFLPKPGDKLFIETEERMVLRGKWPGIAKDIIDKYGK